ncbi:MAG: hypothetical protein AAGC63_06245 [Propionicimonas sp.]|nr:hypothetical protein [Propionicimonas sp.]
MEDFLGFLNDVGHAIWGVWTLDTSLGQWFVTLPYQTAVAVTVAVLAGASTLLGNSVVLFLNRVRGWRFGVSLLMNGVSMVVLYAVQALAIDVVGYLVTGNRVQADIAVKAVLLATAPLILGFFELIPYLGPGIARILQAWGLVALWAVVATLYAVDRWTALLITLVGWALMQLLSWALARPMSAVGRWIWRLVTGRPTMLTAGDLLAGHQFTPVEFDFELPRAGGGKA